MKLFAHCASGERALIVAGARGGRGNASFKTGRNNAPALAEHGEAGAELWLDLELKLVADVGIIGVPNAGKSTLLSVVSPEPYQFTPVSRKDVQSDWVVGIWRQSMAGRRYV